jgi:hypothetical protein
MARKTFFSFHYERDAWRAGQVRNSNLLADEDEYGFVDSVEWEKIERQGVEAIKRWIKFQLEYTSVTVVLIGAETSQRPWVDYEIRESWRRGNGLVGVWIHNVKDQNQKTDTQGANPLDLIKFSDGKPLSSVCKKYDWVLDDGRNNLGKWIEEAFQSREKLGEDKIIDNSGKSGHADAPTVIKSSPAAGFVPRSPWCADYDIGPR